MVFTEAQAMSVPVVATVSGGIPEAVDDGRTGILVNESDIDGLAQALRSCLGDAELSGRFRTAARPWVINHFDLATQTAKLEDLYYTWSG